MSRKAYRAQIAQRRKMATVGIADGDVIQDIRGALTGSNTCRPLKRYKVPTGRVRNQATFILMQLGVGVYG